MFDVQLTQQGTYRIAENGGTFFAGWLEDGKEVRRRGSLEQFLSESIDLKPAVQFMYSARRVESYVTLGAPNIGAFEVSGVGLEFVPITHPNDSYAGELIRFGFLMNGEPASGVELEVIKGEDRYRDVSGVQTVTANEMGEVELTFDQPGQYWLSAQAQGSTVIQDIDMALLSTYALTFEVLPQ